ncbi:MULTISPECIES: TetR/AcrR family transcriptional regulator [Paraburkholderia]|uniref:TetR/AcrR family transcriptional regulator n=1 Tax=Paraburkholderia TaxID=1822464 RepID=UPI002AB6018E|nr:MULTISPECIES: TetR/AcrR family transcriptional regulator [Paraburkholderia]
MKEHRARRSREDIVQQLRGVFREFGYEGATLTRISDETGLGRASLYHHFPNGKDEMVMAVLEEVESVFDHELIARLRGDQPPEERLESMIEHLWNHYQGGSTSCFLAVLALTSNQGPIGASVQRIFLKWIEGIAFVLRDAGVPARSATLQAEEAVGRIQGSLVLAKATGDPSIFQRVMKALPKSLLPESEPAKDVRPTESARGSAPLDKHRNPVKASDEIRVNTSPVSSRRRDKKLPE